MRYGPVEVTQAPKEINVHYRQRIVWRHGGSTCLRGKTPRYKDCFKCLNVRGFGSRSIE